MLNHPSRCKPTLPHLCQLNSYVLIMGSFLFFNLFSFIGFDPTTPSLFSSAFAKSTCGLDQFEPNNQRYQARHLMSLTRHQSIHAHLCASDTDWFSIWLNRGQWIELQLESADLGALQTFTLFAPRRRKSTGLYRQHSLYKSIRIHIKESGRYRLKVGSSSSETIRYTLSLIHLDPRYPHAPILTPSLSLSSSKPTWQ